MKKLLIFLLGLYKKFISPFLVINFGHACRFNPTCGEYAKEAIKKFGIGRGMWLGLKRILRCNPYGEFGYDPVPLGKFKIQNSKFKII